MLEAEINLWAVLVAGVVSMAIGAVWYNVFSKQWLKGVGLTEKQVTEGSKLPYLITFLAELLIAYVIAHVFFYYGGTDAIDGVQTAFWMWLGFGAAVTAINYSYQRKSLKLFAIDAGYSLVFFIVSGAIIGAWQ